MPRDYVFGGNRDAMAKAVDRDLAFNTAGPIRPVRRSDLGSGSDLDIARGALGGRYTTGKLPEKRRAINRPPDNTEQVPPSKPRRKAVRRLQRPVQRKGGR